MQFELGMDTSKPTKARCLTPKARCLTVGDGDLSYSLALARRFGPTVELTASTLCTHEELIGTYAGVAKIVAELEGHGAKLSYRVDATDLMAAGTPPQDHILFNHPHLGLSDLERPEEHARRHQVLLGHFLASALTVLSPDGGLIHLTLCGNQRQAWCVDEHARRLGLKIVDSRNVKAPPLYGRVQVRMQQPIESTFPIPRRASIGRAVWWQWPGKKWPRALPEAHD